MVSLRTKAGYSRRSLLPSPISTNFFPNRMYEFDRKGKQLTETQLTGYTLRLQYR